MKRHELITSVIASAVVIASNSSTARGQCEPQWLPGQGIAGLNGTVYAVTTWDPDGAGPLAPLLVAGGAFTTAQATTVVNNIAVWNGSSWQALGAGMGGNTSPYVYALTVYNGQLIAGGNFTSAGGSPANRIARWNGTSWQPLGIGMLRAVTALAVFNNELIAGGNFNVFDGSLWNYVARWNGASWQSLGSGIGPSVGDDHVRALTVFNGELIVGGYFLSAGGLPAHNIARWNGNAWQALENGIKYLFSPSNA